MKTDLLLVFENLLDEEAERIAKKIIENNEMLNDPFSELIEKYISEKFQYYITEITLRTSVFLDKNKNFNQIKPDINSIVLHLEKYSEYCRNNEDKDHKKAAQKFSEILLNYWKTELKSEISLLQLISDNISILFEEHNDSVDVRTLLLYLQEEIEKNGYVISSIEPFKMIKKI